MSVKSTAGDGILTPRGQRDGEYDLEGGRDPHDDGSLAMSHPTTANPTFYSNGIALGGGAWNWGASNTLYFYTYAPGTAMNIGFVGTGWSLDDDAIASFCATTAVGGTVVFGYSQTLGAANAQYGAITFKTADFSAANSNAGVAIVANSDYYNGSNYGTVTFDSESGTKTALLLGSKALTVKAYTAISAAAVPDAKGHISTTGAVSLNVDASSGLRIGQGDLSTGLADYPIEIGSGASSVSVSGSAPSGVWLMGVGGSIAYGTLSATGYGVISSVYNDSDGTIYLATDLTTSGDLSFAKPVQLRPASGTSITITATGHKVTFGSTLDEYSGGAAGTDSLSIATGSGDQLFTGAVGGTRAIKDFSVSSAAAVTISGGIGTTSATGANNVSIAHTGLLTIADKTSASDTTYVDLNLGGTFSESDSSATGTVHIAGDIATANKSITFNRPVTLTGDVLLSSGSGTQIFQTAATIDGAFGLSLNSTGTVTLDLALGSSTSLASLTTDASGTTAIDGGSVKTSGAQTYNDAVTLGGTTTLTANSIAFASTCTGSSTLALVPVSRSTDATIGTFITKESLGMLQSGFTGVSIGYSDGTGTISVSSSGIALSNDLGLFTIQSGDASGVVKLDGPVTTTGATALAINVSGATGSVKLNDSTATILGTGSRAIDVYGNVVLDKDATLSSMASGSGATISFHGTVDAATGAESLTVTAGGTASASSGDITFGKTVGAITPLGNFQATCGTFTTSSGENLTVGGTNTIALSIDALSRGGTIGCGSGSGTITIEPRAPSGVATYDFDINDSTANGGNKRLSLTTADLQNIVTTGSLVLGSSAWAGNFYIGKSGNIDLSSTTSYSLSLVGHGSSSYSNANFGFTNSAYSLKLASGKSLDFALAGGTISSTATADADVTLSGSSSLLTITSAGQVGTSSATPWKVSVPYLGASTLSGALYLSDGVSLEVKASVNTNANALDITTAGATGLTLSADLLSSAGGVNLSSGSGGVSVGGSCYVGAAANSGAITIDGGTGSIVLGHATYGSATLRTTNAGASSVSILRGSSLVLGPVSASGGLVVGTSSKKITGAVSQYGATVLTATTVTGETGSTVALTNANLIAEIAGFTTNSSTGAASLQFNTASTSALTVSSAISTTSASGFDDDVTITAAKGISLGAGIAVHTTGSVALNATSGGVTQSGGIIAANGLQLAGAGAFTLDDANTVSDLAVSTTGGDVKVTSSSALTLASVTTNGVTTAKADVSISDNLTITAPSLAQSVAITAKGLELLGALAGNIGLTEITNSFTNLAGLLTVGSGTNTIAVTNSSSTKITTVTGGGTAGMSTAGQAFTLISSGDVTQDQAIDVGTALLSVTTKNDSGAKIDLSVSANAADKISLKALTTAIAEVAASGAVAYKGVAGFDVQAITTASTLDLTAGGDVTQSSGPILVGALATITAATNAVDFQTNGAGNDFAAVYAASSGSLKLKDSNGYSLYGSSSGVSGPIDATTAAGAITVTSSGLATSGGALKLHPYGDLQVDGTVSTNYTAGTLTLLSDHSGTIYLNNAAAPLVYTTDANITFSSPVILQNDATVQITQDDANTYTAQFSQAVNSVAAHKTLKVGGAASGQKVDVTLGGQVGASGTELSGLTVSNAQNVSLANIGPDTAYPGVLGTTSVSASVKVTFTGTNYNGHEMSFTAASGSTILPSAGSATTFTTNGYDLTLGGATAGTILLSSGTNLIVNSSGTATGGKISALGGMEGTNGETVTLDATTSGGTSNRIIDLGTVGSGGKIHSLTLKGADGITLNGSIKTDDTASNAVSITGPVTLGATPLTIDTSANSGGISFIGASSKINGAMALSLKTATGDVVMTGAAGGITPLASLMVTSSGGGTVDLNDVSTVGGISVTTSGITTLNGSAYTVTGNATASDPMTFAGPLLLTQTTTTFTGGGQGVTYDDAISFNGTVNASASGKSIVIKAAASSVGFYGTVGTASGDTTHRPQNLTVDSAGKLTFGGTSTAFYFADNISLTLDDLDILDPLYVEGTGSDGVLSIFNRSASNAISLGSATGGISLDNTDLGNIRTARVITIGKDYATYGALAQTGTITATGAQLHSGVANLAAVKLYSDNGAGAIALTSPSAIGLDLNGNADTVLTLSVGTGGITASNGGYASISNVGSGSTTILKTNSTGATTNLGLATSNATRIAFLRRLDDTSEQQLRYGRKRRALRPWLPHAGRKRDERYGQQGPRHRHGRRVQRSHAEAADQPGERRPQARAGREDLRGLRGELRHSLHPLDGLLDDHLLAPRPLRRHLHQRGRGRRLHDHRFRRFGDGGRRDCGRAQLHHRWRLGLDDQGRRLLQRGHRGGH